MAIFLLTNFVIAADAPYILSVIAALAAYFILAWKEKNNLGKVKSDKVTS